MKSILWILNGCGLEGRGITGGPVRFHIERRLIALGTACAAQYDRNAIAAADSAAIE